MTAVGFLLMTAGLWYLMARAAMAIKRWYWRMILWDMKGWFIPMPRETLPSGADHIIPRYMTMTPWEEAGAIAVPAPWTLTSDTRLTWNPDAYKPKTSFPPPDPATLVL